MNYDLAFGKLKLQKKASSKSKMSKNMLDKMSLKRLQKLAKKHKVSIHKKGTKVLVKKSTLLKRLKSNRSIKKILESASRMKRTSSPKRATKSARFGGHQELTNKMLSKLFPEHIPEIVDKISESNKEKFLRLDNEIYIREFAKDNNLIISEESIKILEKKPRSQLNILFKNPEKLNTLLKYLDTVNDAKIKAIQIKEIDEKLIKYRNDLLLKQQELERIMQKRNLRSNKFYYNKIEKEIQEINNLIRKLLDTRSELIKFNPKYYQIHLYHRNNS